MYLGHKARYGCIILFHLKPLLKRKICLKLNILIKIVCLIYFKYLQGKIFKNKYLHVFFNKNIKIHFCNLLFYILNSKNKCAEIYSIRFHALMIKHKLKDLNILLFKFQLILLIQVLNPLSKYP